MAVAEGQHGLEGPVVASIQEPPHLVHIAVVDHLQDARIDAFVQVVAIDPQDLQIEDTVVPRHHLTEVRGELHHFSPERAVA